MTREEFEALGEGDIIQSASGQGYVVTANYGDWKIAVRTVTVTNPKEWKLARKSEEEREVNEEIFGIYLADKLKAAGKTQADFAATVGLSAQYMTDMKKGNRSPSTALLEGMEAHLSCDLDEAYWLAGRITPDVYELMLEVGPREWRRLREHYALAKSNGNEAERRN